MEEATLLLIKIPNIRHPMLTGRQQRRKKDDGDTPSKIPPLDANTKGCASNNKV
jgi:hypothetical protein